MQKRESLVQKLLSNKCQNVVIILFSPKCPVVTSIEVSMFMSKYNYHFRIPVRIPRRIKMSRRTLIASLAIAATMLIVTMPTTEAAGQGQPTNWERFYHYPYVYYPQNFQNTQQEYNSLYYRYPANRRIPVYRKDWHNYYPSPRPYHSGHHFILDVF